MPVTPSLLELCATCDKWVNWFRFKVACPSEKIFQLCRAVSQPVKKTDTKTDSKEQTMSRKNLPESKKDRLLKKKRRS